MAGYIDSRLLRVVKRRVFDELTDSVQQHYVYRDKVKVYHKFPYKERPMFGVVLKNASGSRERLSPDDFAGTMASHVSLAKAQGKEGRLLKWVWEDETAVTKLKDEEDLSSQLSGTTSHGTNRVFRVANTPIVSGPHNTKVADNFRQIQVKVNDETTYAEFLDGEEGIIMLPEAPTTDSTITVSYYYKNIVDPGRYYIELLDETHFVIDPIYQIKEEKIINRTSGVETSASLDHGNLLSGSDVLYTKRYERSNKIQLVRDTDYTIDSSGNITFLNSLPASNTLYGDYRWVGSTMGPFDMPDGDHQYNNSALPGVILAFGSERIINDKNVVLVWPERDTAAKVYSGHWIMNFDIDVMSRDTVQLPELTDHIVEDMWTRKRVPLIMEGLTMETCEPVGEVEEVYDENTGDLYYKNSVNLVFMSEWKRFVPYLSEIEDFTTNINQYGPKTHDYVVTEDGRILKLDIVPYSEPFEVKYTEPGQVRYY